LKYLKLQLSLCRHYKSSGESHGKERLKRKLLRHPRKTDIEGVDVTCWGRMFQVRAAAAWKARSPAVYEEHSATVRKRNAGSISGPLNQPCTGAHQRDRMVLSHADTCTQEKQVWTGSALGWRV